MASIFGNGNVIVVSEDRFFDVELERAGKKLVVVDFTASWCGPCQRIAPFFVQLSMKFLSVTFLKVDVDQCPFTAESNGIRAMPTFQFFRSKVKVEEMTGADTISLEKKIKELTHPHVATNRIVNIDPKRVAVGRSWACFIELAANERDVFLETSDLILKFANNILNNPDNKKYRCIRIGNSIFQKKLLPVMGGVECLFAMGFEEQDDNLVFPSKTSLDALTTLRDTIHDERIQRLQTPCSSQPKRHLSPHSTDSLPNRQATSPSATISTQEMSINQLQFYAKLHSSSDHVMLYEDPDLQRHARTFIPLSDLERKAESMSKSSKQGEEKGIHAGDCLILTLLDWFKTEFFQWMDKPKCPSCKTESIICKGIVPPTSEEELWLVGSVENYQCTGCHRMIRFPRYNHPKKLLETRRGRCGEWANCFTLFCRSLGYDCRHVVDWTDHVWTEVYSEAQQRWLHCDACEGTCDKPLLYEAGWGKRLTYVIAFSVDQVVDVTWRYSIDHQQVKLRRKDVSENWLQSTIAKMTEQLQMSMPPERREMLQTRLIKELVEFMTPHSVSNSELQGRVSGSLAWRTMRGEMGLDKSVCRISPYTFKPTETEINNQRLRVRYSASNDCYYRCTENTIAESYKADLIGWKCGVNAVKWIFRKVETDWKMAYLARIEGKPSGEISWKVDVSDSGHVIDDVTILVRGTTFENGHVEWIAQGDDKQSQSSALSGDGAPQTLFNLRGSKTLILTARLGGGRGDVAWQHAQLFRQSLHSTNEHPLDIEMKLIKDEES